MRILRYRMSRKTFNLFIFSHPPALFSICSGMDYEHLTVNHKVTFVDRTTGAHTNTIEGLWAHVKRDFKNGGRKIQHMDRYLAVFMFKRMIASTDEELFTEFLKVANTLLTHAP